MSNVKGWSDSHRARAIAAVRANAVARFWGKVDKSEGCWLWRGRVGTHGYGVSQIFGEALAHRVAYRLTVGDVPEGLTLDHLCRNRICVNPVHLEPVTNRENILRGDGPSAQLARRELCPRGHMFAGVRPTTGYRFCRTCSSKWRHDDYQRRRALSLTGPAA